MRSGRLPPRARQAQPAPARAPPRVRDGAAVTAGAAGAGADMAAGAVAVAAAAPFTTYPVVTRKPFCSASAQLSGVTAAPLIPVAPSRRGTSSPDTALGALRPFFGSK